MSRKVVSIRGEVVDFDLFEIKKQILGTSANDNVKKRERFIDKKRRRTNRNSINQLIKEQQDNKTMVKNAMDKTSTVDDSGEIKADTSDAEVKSIESKDPQIIRKK